MSARESGRPDARRGGAVVALRGGGVRYESASGATEALRDLTLEVAPGEFVCIVGPSGCGKTTLLRVVAGLQPATAGTVAWGDGDTTGSGGGADKGGAGGGDARVRLAYVFQEPRLLPWLTALQNVALPLREGRLATAPSLGAGAAGGRARTEAALRRARDWLARVGLEGFENRFPRELSGGMNQRVALARAFAVEPTLLLMDEPFSGLDELTARRLRADLAAACRESGAACLFVTHNPWEAAFLGDRVAVLSPRPGSVRAAVAPDVPRPRRYDSREVFEAGARIVEALGGAADTGDLLVK